MGVNRPVFTHGPPGPGRQIFRGGILNKSRIELWYAEKKGCPRERNLREIYTEYNVGTEFSRCDRTGRGGAKISWAQGRKVPKYGPGCETWALTVWGNIGWGCSRIGCQRRYMDVTGDCTILHNECFDVFSSPNIIQVIGSRRMGDECGRHGWEEKFIQSCGGKARKKETTFKT